MKQLTRGNQAGDLNRSILAWPGHVNCMAKPVIAKRECPIACGVKAGRGVLREASRPFFVVATKFKAHCGKQFVGEIRFAAGGKAFEKSGAQNRHRRAFFNGGCDGPAPFARV